MWQVDIGEWHFKNRPEIIERRNPGVRMEKSTQEYWKDIDLIVRKLGIEERIAKIRQLIQNGNKDEEALKRQLDELLVPVYIELREQGYSQLDIWS